MADKQTTASGRSMSNGKATPPDSKTSKTPATPKPSSRTSTQNSTLRGTATPAKSAQNGRSSAQKTAAPSANATARKTSSTKAAASKSSGKTTSAAKSRAASTRQPIRQRPTMPRPDIARWESTARRLLRRVAALVKTLTDPAVWRRLGQMLPPWSDELGAILLIVFGVTLLTALLNTTSEAVLSIRISSISQQIFGGAAYLFALGLLGGGITLLLPKFGITFEPGWTRTAALEIAFGAFTALLHLLTNDPEPRALAREGGGGGYLGWTLSQLTTSLVGSRLSIVLYGVLLFGSLIMISGFRRKHLVWGLAALRTRLQTRLIRLETDVYEENPVYLASTPAAPEIAPEAYTLATVSPAAAPVTIPETSAPVRRSPSITRSSDSAPRSNGTGTPKPVPSTVPDPVIVPPAATAPANTESTPSAPILPPTREELKKMAEETRRNLGGTNGRSLVSPGEPGERESVVPREYLPDARVVSAAPRARARRRQLPTSERYFTVDDFREIKKISRRDEGLPPLELLSDIELNKPTEEEINLNARIIKNTLLEFDVETEVIDVKVGPTVTQYAVSPYTESVNDEGETVLNRVRVSQIANLNGDLALALSAKRLRIQAPVPGHSYVGVEVPNHQPSVVALRPVLESEVFHKYRKRPLALPLGRDVSGDSFVTDLQTMPHLLIAGTTGSGKSIMLAAMTTALIMNSTPDQLRLVLLDPKMVELSRFNGIPHLMGPVETDLDRIIGVLRWATREMDRRYKLLEKEAARHLEAYNQALGKRRKDEHLPYIVIIIDEIGDLMMQRPDETERTLTRLAQMARAVGIHLMVATQRPSVDVITGLIKANFPARISFAVASGVDSRVILDTTGAETLMGRGDMLFLAPDAAGPRRIQGCFVSDDEVNGVVEYWRSRPSTEGEDGHRISFEAAPWERGMTRREVLAETDPMLEDAIALVIEEGEASASLIQRRLGLGYPRAARIMDHLHELGVVGAAQPGGRSRKVLVKPGSDPFKTIIDKRLDDKK